MILMQLSKQATFDTYATIAETNPRYTKKEKDKKVVGINFQGNIMCSVVDEFRFYMQQGRDNNFDTTQQHD